MNKKFSCPKCGEKVSFREVFNFKRNYITSCSKCGTKLIPKSIKSWNFGFFIGFLGVVVPAYLVLYFYKSFFFAAIVGIATGTIAILSVALYTYLTTAFKEMD